jgi:hypothetical protein
MSEFNSNESGIEPERGSRKTNFLWRQLPYVAALVLAIAGVAYTNISQQPLVGYWEFLALAMAVVCIVTQWESFPERSARIRLMWTQALHWAAVLVAMNIMVLSRVQAMFPAPAISLVLLTLLALGTFLAGVSFLSPQICFLGVAMAVAVPAIAWLTQSFLFIVLVAVLLAGLGVAFWPGRAKDRAA